jgi:hypothetical protein
MNKHLFISAKELHSYINWNIFIYQSGKQNLKNK